MITQDVSKEERAQKVNGNILGNCKMFWSEQGQAPQQSQPQQQAPQQQQQAPPTGGEATSHGFNDSFEDSDLPF